MLDTAINVISFNLLIINPRPEGYSSRFVCHSLTLGACARVTVLGLSFAVHRAAENSDHFYALVKLWHDKHRNGLQFDSWILLKCFHSRVMADSP